MDHQRSKKDLAKIYEVVSQWYDDAEIPYIAHAVDRNGAVVPLAKALSSAASTSPTNHPDQRYWRHANNANAADPGIKGNLMKISNLDRIEIDCKLLPCTRQNGCLFRVPYLIRELYGLRNTKLLIFSHADESLQKQGSTKRVIACTTSDTDSDLTAAYNAHSGWSWQG